MKMQVGFALLMLTLSAGAQAQVFKCTDGQGKVTFSQVPCSGQEAEKIEVRNNEIGGQFATGKEVSDHKLRREVERDLRKVDRMLAERPEGVCKEFTAQELRTMIVRNEVVPGMKIKDVYSAWGRPDESSDRRYIWWFGTTKGSFVWHKDGCVESMSGPGYRGSKFVR